MSHILAERLAVTGDRVLLIALDDADAVPQTAGGLYLPQQSLDRQLYRQWEVYAIGPEVGMDLKVGDRVILDGRFAGEPMDWRGTTVRFVREPNIIAVLEESELGDVHSCGCGFPRHTHGCPNGRCYCCTDLCGACEQCTRCMRSGVVEGE